MPLASVVALFNELCHDGINYRLGEKDPNTGFLDCSGWIHYACERYAPTWAMPDGSYNQMDWCTRQQLRGVKYSEAAHADAARLFIAFITADDTHNIGHVWFLNYGETMECHGGGGIDSRDWDTPVLLTEVSHCFELPAKSG